MKNLDLIATNIEEAKEELVDLLKEIASDPEYTEGELRIALEHAYHHLNFAWHIRDVDVNRAGECSKEDFVKWSKYPVGEIFEYE